MTSAPISSNGLLSLEEAVGEDKGSYLFSGGHRPPLTGNGHLER